LSWKQKEFEKQDKIEDFMMPYPASLFKLMIVFRLARLFDLGKMNPNTIVSYFGESRTIQNWADPMITISDNYATKALLKYLDIDGKVEDMDRDFDYLGLNTLKIGAINQTDGYGWNLTTITMGAADTAKLLLLIYGKTSGELWKTPNNLSITREFLSDSSRSFILNLLKNQGYNGHVRYLIKYIINILTYLT
jgi:hypothetical protein